MASNPRIDGLRKRIDKDPGSRLFAQLAEELRKDGDLEDAIRVARQGLHGHPNYPSARMTLGRALLDTGDWAAARIEFELVLKGAADNILASRYLAECLENLGEREAAIARYKATLAMAPGEKHVVARLHELEGAAPSAAPAAGQAPPGPASGAFRLAMGLRPGTSTLPAGERSVRASVPTAPTAPPAQVVAPEPPAAVAPAFAPPPSAASLPPIPLATVDGEMELETGRSAPEPAAPPPPSASASPKAPIPLAVADEEFELEAPYAAPSPRRAPSIRPLPVVQDVPPPAARPVLASLAPTPTAAAPSALISPTLGELYFNQGFTDKAIEVYRELSTREPGNERLGARLRELEKLQSALAGGEPAVTAPPVGASEPEAAADTAPADRRQAIERTIVRLTGLLSSIRKG